MKHAGGRLKVQVIALAALLVESVLPAEEVPTVAVTRGELKVLFRDNSQSPKVLSGVASLFHKQASPDFDAYDPDTRGASAGLNFEHIISGHRSEHNSFTPRKGRYALSLLPDGRSAMLVRERQDSPWSVSSRLKYVVREPHYIDFEFRCRPHDRTVFGERGYAIFFFANYMNDVADHRIHFRGIEGPGKKESWIAADAPKQHPDWNQGGTWRHASAEALECDEDHNFRLNSWSYDYPRFTQPFYYGRAANGMVLMLMFDRTRTGQDEIRFSLFKFKLRRFPRPAWDFQYVIREIEEGREYGFKARLVWKKFVSQEDCLSEFAKWKASLKAVSAKPGGL